MDVNRSSELIPSRSSGLQDGDRLLVAAAAAPLLVEQPEKAPPKEKMLTFDKKAYFLPMIEKHGDNYDAMFRDIKLNYEQLSKSQLKRKCAWLKQKIAEEEQQIEVEEESENAEEQGDDVQEEAQEEEVVEQLPEEEPQKPQKKNKKDGIKLQPVLSKRVRL